MQQEAEVLTAPVTEDSPTKKTDSVTPEETGQEKTTPDEPVGTEEGWTPEMGFDKHPDWIKREETTAEKVREAEAETAQAKAQAELLERQLRQTQTAPVEEPVRWTEAELEQKVYDGEITDGQKTTALARQAAEDVVVQNEGQRAVAESNQRAMKLVPDLGTSGSGGQKLFMQLATTEFATLYDQTTGNPLVMNANEIVARETKRQLDTQAAAGRSKASEDQRLAAIGSQGTDTNAPHGRGAEEDMSDSMDKLTQNQKDHLAKRGQLTKEGVRDYLKYTKDSDTHSRPFPEKARRPSG